MFFSLIYFFAPFSIFYSPHNYVILQAMAHGLCRKVGRGKGDGHIGTRVWGLGTWDLGTRDEGLEDIKYGTRGRVGRGRGDVKNRDAGDAGCE